MSVYTKFGGPRYCRLRLYFDLGKCNFLTGNVILQVE